MKYSAMVARWPALNSLMWRNGKPTHGPMELSDKWDFVLVQSDRFSFIAAGSRVDHPEMAMYLSLNGKSVQVDIKPWGD